MVNCSFHQKCPFIGITILTKQRDVVQVPMWEGNQGSSSGARDAAAWLRHKLLHCG